MTNKIVVFTKALLLLVAVLGFTACESDESIFDRIVGRSWVGDLGFQEDGYDLESCVTFDSNGFGEDSQCYYDFDKCLPILPVRWWIENGTLYIDYGRDFYMRELRYVYVEKGILTGTLFIDGQEYGGITLRMQ